MTNMEKFISIMRDYSQECESIINSVYEIQNKKDWKYFCSGMGDYDHPSERREADEIFEREIKELAEKVMGECLEWKLNLEIKTLKELAEQIGNSGFYSKHFHTMNEKYSE